MAPRILIIGAGMGGLTAAIALLQAGFPVEVHEQASVLRELGAGLTISPGANLVFEALGLGSAVRARASVTRAMAFLQYQTGALLHGGYDYETGESNGEPELSLHIHRADLHQILAEGYARAGGALHLGRRFVGVDETAAGVRARFEDGSEAEGDIVVGADGLRSAVRHHLWGDGNPRFTGQVAYRCIVPGETAKPYLSAGRAAIYFGPRRLFNRYSLRAGAIVNCVAIAQSEEWRGEGWTTPATPEELVALFEGWHADVTGLMSVAPREHLIKWALFDREPLPRWRQGGVTLLGDAAHPMLPFLGLGAAMAIEDAIVLTRALKSEPGTAGLDLYEKVRLPRTTQVALAAQSQGEMFQARDGARYDASAAPAHDRSLFDFDPVRCPM